jgi:protein subunit release factor B
LNERAGDADVLTASHRRAEPDQPESRMLDFGVSDQKQEALRAKMDRLGIREEDLVEKFVRSSGPGGQKVNKAATCVYLKHVPTDIEVKVQRERSQALNRFFARRLLAEKIERLITGRVAKEQELREKIRRRKRTRSRRAKEKTLQQKKLQSEKKHLREKPDADA